MTKFIGSIVIDRYRLTLSCTCLLILIISQTVSAQLGRGPKRDDSPASTSARKVSKEAPLRLIAAEYVPSINVNFGTELAFRSFLERFQESGFIKISGKKSQTQGSNRSREKRKRTVCRVDQLEVDLMGSNDVEKDSEKASVSPINPACLYVSYAIFAPGSGKAITQGHVYQPGYQDRCVGGVYHPSPYPDRPLPTRAPPEITIKQAARDAADRVMTALDIALAPKHP